MQRQRRGSLAGIEIAAASGKPELLQCRHDRLGTQRLGSADGHGTLVVAHLGDDPNVAQPLEVAIPLRL